MTVSCPTADIALYSMAKTRFQSFFMLMIVHPIFCHVSKPHSEGAELAIGQAAGRPIGVLAPCRRAAAAMV
jgi:hypothetical protein